MDDNRVLIFDTTLRDGEQSPGISLNTAEKLEIAQQLARLGVDIIEAGFPIASPGDFEAVQAIARQVAGPDHRRPRAREPGRHRPRLGGGPRRRAPAHPHVHLDVGHPHRAPDAEHARGRARPGARRGRAGEARSSTTSSSRRWTPRAPTSSSPPRSARSRSTRARRRSTSPTPSATRCRTSTPRYLEQPVRAARPACAGVVLSVHCHDDLGLAVANSFAGVLAGARQVECAINGIGERAGNASLEEIVMLLSTRGDAVVGLHTGIVTTRDRAHEPPRLAAHRLPGPAEQGDRRAQRVRARVGHPPGRRPEGAHDVRDHGRDARSAWTPTSSCWASTPVATRCARRSRSSATTVDGQALNTAFKRFKEIADKKKQVTAMDLEALVTDELREETGYALESLRRRGELACARRTRPSRCACPTGRLAQGSFTGDGPIDAVFHAINAADRRRRAAARVPRRRRQRAARTRSAT